MSTSRNVSVRANLRVLQKLEVTVNIDETLEYGDFRIETDVGTINQQVSEQVTQCRDELQVLMVLNSSQFGVDLDALSKRLTSDLKPVVEGKVTQVVGLVIEGNVPDVQMGTLCEIFVDDAEPLMAEVVGFRGNTALMMPLDDISGIRMGSRIRPRPTAASVPVGPQMLGRVFDGLGRPLDGKGTFLTLTVTCPLCQTTQSA